MIRKKFAVDVEYVGGRGFGTVGSTQVGYVLSLSKKIPIVMQGTISSFVNMKLNSQGRK